MPNYLLLINNGGVMIEKDDKNANTEGILLLCFCGVPRFAAFTINKSAAQKDCRFILSTEEFVLLH